MTSGEPPDFAPEIECKFVVPDYAATVDLPDLLQRLFPNIAIHGGITKHRRFTYFDTTDFELYHRGWTFRRIDGFHPEIDSSAKGRHRFDVKIGDLEHRKEANVWSDAVEDVATIVSRLKLPRWLAEVKPVASASTRHDQCELVLASLRVLATLDTFEVDEGGRFRELELELADGDTREFNEFVRSVTPTLGLVPEKRQKYAKVLESLTTRRLQGL